MNDQVTEQTSLFSKTTNTDSDSTVGTSITSSSSTSFRKNDTTNNDGDLQQHKHPRNTKVPAMGDCGGSDNEAIIHYSSHVVVSYRLSELRSVSMINLWLALFCLIYLGINVCLLCVNYVNRQYDKTHKTDDDEEPVNDYAYHLVEFWATFCFAVVEYLAIVHTPTSRSDSSSSSTGSPTRRSSSSSGTRRSGKVIQNPVFLRIIMFINIVATITPAVMISFSLETFEIASHEIEYINELTMTVIDIAIAISLWNSTTTTMKSSKNAFGDTKSGSIDKPNTEDQQQHYQCSMWTTICISAIVAFIQLGVYNLMGYDTETGDMVGEPLGHFLEFLFEIVSSLMAFIFCMDNKSIADQEIISTLLYHSQQLQAQHEHEQHDLLL